MLVVHTNKRLPIVLILAFILTGCSQESKNFRDFMEEQKAHQEIERLHARYFELMDAVQNQRDDRPTPAEMIETLFIKEGFVQVGDELMFRGKEGLPKFVEWLAAIHEDGVYVKHYGMNAEIKVAGNIATSKQQLLMVRSDKRGDEAAWLTGHYINTFEKNTEGRWKLKSKTFQGDDYTSWLAKPE